ncbi:hypothetical protein ANTPLA_LOCUS7016 [Anthophora plagiata]
MDAEIILPKSLVRNSDNLHSIKLVQLPFTGGWLENRVSEIADELERLLLLQLWHDLWTELSADQSEQKFECDGIMVGPIFLPN